MLAEGIHHMVVQHHSLTASYLPVSSIAEPLAGHATILQSQLFLKNIYMVRLVNSMSLRSLTP